MERIGLILTNKKTIYNKLLKLRINGVNKNSTKSWENDVSEIGFNYKISELTAPYKFTVKKIKSIYQI